MIRTPIGMTMCSGIGAPEVAAPWVDWRFASEIEAFPRAVLEARFGYRPPEAHNQGDPLLWDDMAQITPELLQRRGVPLPDLVVAGTPCQAFSVAGLRKGTADPRGNLTLKFVELCHDLVAARPDGRLAVLWENVPGVLSDENNAFGCFLGGLVGSLAPLDPGGDGGWPGEGMVAGPRARAAWAVLDAQWFGVAQRRRRVFVVVDFGGACDPAAVLLEPDRLRGDSPPRREAGERPSPTLAARSRGGLGTDFDCDGGLIASTGEVAHCLNAGGMGRSDYETETMIAHALRGEGFDASEDVPGRGTPLAYGLTTEQTPKFAVDRALTLTSGGELQCVGVPPAIAFHNRQDPDVSGAVTHPLGAKDNGLAVAFAENSRGELRLVGGDGEVMSQLTTGGGKPGQGQPTIAEPWAVRRLTPQECHRLQGFPDGHCAIPMTRRVRREVDAEFAAYVTAQRADRDEAPPTEAELQHLAADGPQYKALGNSMAVPVIAWILDRMAISAGWRSP